MKKIVGCIFVVLISFIALVSYKNNKDDFPNKPPITNINVNNVEYKTIQGEGNWLQGKLPDGNVPGSSYLVDLSEALNENCSFIEVNSGDELKFDISYKHNIQEVTLYNIDFTDSKKKEEDVLISNESYSFKSPESKGEYYYAFNVRWDDTHNFDYLFKIKVV